MQTVEMFLQAEVRPSLDQRVARAIEALGALFTDNRMVICQFSAGKDSGVVTSLALDAARRHAAAGGRPHVCVITADTLVESPEMVEHAQRELEKMAAFGREHGFDVRVQVVAPSLATSWQLAVLTGRALPSYAGTNSDCSVSLKIEPSRVGRNQLYREARKAGYAEPVVLLGTRFDESERRKAKMTARGDRADTPVRNSDGELTLCPIADWSTEDVWEFIGEVSSGLRDSYTDFEETKRIYAHAGNSSCAIVSDLTFEEASAGNRVRRGHCDARTGCWTCQQADDRSLAEMIRFDEDRYAYARGLQQLNRFIRAIRYDWSRRNWVGRTIREGYICLEPDTFGAATVRELVRYMLTIDRDERIRARRAGTHPKFQTLPLPMMIAVDAMQSLQGLAAPFAIWADYRDICERGVSYSVPEITPAAPAPLPEPLFLKVGTEWDDTADQWTGFRDPLFEALTERSPCAPTVMDLGDGKSTWEVRTGTRFDVDVESAEMILEFEADRLADMHDRGFHPGGITAGYRWYLSYGALTLSHKQQLKHDEVARRTDFKDRLGLNLGHDAEQLVQQGVRFGDLPDNARHAWAHKATTAGAQTTFEFAFDS
ncbi:phosphoadenosine phosphosulfate reductase family protein [Burkholderia cenocepacia]|uniref:phosphoadenosine phosphosulfate reductase domain-containing protein n=1 Tax=Burkholderia cenocepacia TaxID=95486 RepID=UPI001B9302A3|nr:phosphoadenosine phosphosulfate reductase family protein [Burkholderia cenocepacia]MBR7989535.1 phosphoadenosine phosphosulfate reductase family protein [Burkholderia cenocepacia]